MKTTKIKLTKEELLKTLTIISSETEIYKEATKSEDDEIKNISEEWLKDLKSVIEKLEKALDEFYQAPF